MPKAKEKDVSPPMARHLAPWEFEGVLVFGFVSNFGDFLGAVWSFLGQAV